MKTPRRELVAIALAAVVVAAAASAYGGLFPQAHGPGGDHGHGDAHAGHAQGEHAEGEEEGSGGSGAVASAILISLAGVALVPLTAFVRRRELTPDRAAATAAATSAADTRPLLASVAMLSAGAALIHFAVIAPHLDEWWVTGIFFILLAPVQLAWAILVLLRPAPILLLAGLAGNLLVAAVWVFTRTAGLPIGPETGEPEAIGLADVVATAFELLLAAGAFAVIRPSGLAGRFPQFGRPVTNSAVGLIVIALTAISLISLVEL